MPPVPPPRRLSLTPQNSVPPTETGGGTRRRRSGSFTQPQPHSNSMLPKAHRRSSTSTPPASSNTTAPPPPLKKRVVEGVSTSHLNSPTRNHRATGAPHPKARRTSVSLSPSSGGTPNGMGPSNPLPPGRGKQRSSEGVGSAPPPPLPPSPTQSAAAGPSSVSDIAVTQTDDAVGVPPPPHRVPVERHDVGERRQVLPGGAIASDGVRVVPAPPPRTSLNGSIGQLVPPPPPPPPRSSGPGISSIPAAPVLPYGSLHTGSVGEIDASPALPLLEASAGLTTTRPFSPTSVLSPPAGVPFGTFTGDPAYHPSSIHSSGGRLLNASGPTLVPPPPPPVATVGSRASDAAVGDASPRSRPSFPFDTLSPFKAPPSPPPLPPGAQHPASHIPPLPLPLAPTSASSEALAFSPPEAGGVMMLLKAQSTGGSGGGRSLSVPPPPPSRQLTGGGAGALMSPRLPSAGVGGHGIGGGSNRSSLSTSAESAAARQVLQKSLHPNALHPSGAVPPDLEKESSLTKLGFNTAANDAQHSSSFFPLRTPSGDGPPRHSRGGGVSFMDSPTTVREEDLPWIEPTNNNPASRGALPGSPPPLPVPPSPAASPPPPQPVFAFEVVTGAGSSAANAAAMRAMLRTYPTTRRPSMEALDPMLEGRGSIPEVRLSAELQQQQQQQRSRSNSLSGSLLDVASGSHSQSTSRAEETPPKSILSASSFTRDLRKSDADSTSVQTPATDPAAERKISFRDRISSTGLQGKRKNRVPRRKGNDGPARRRGSRRRRVKQKTAKPPEHLSFLAAGLALFFTQRMLQVVARVRREAQRVARMPQAAFQIQCCWRRYRQMARLRVIRAGNFIATWLTFRYIELQRAKERSARYLQRYFKGEQSRGFVRFMHYHMHLNRALAVLRSYVQRWEAQNLRNSLRDARDERNYLIQSCKQGALQIMRQERQAFLHMETEARSFLHICPLFSNKDWAEEVVQCTGYHPVLMDSRAVVQPLYFQANASVSLSGTMSAVQRGGWAEEVKMSKMVAAPKTGNQLSGCTFPVGATSVPQLQPAVSSSSLQPLHYVGQAPSIGWLSTSFPGGCGATSTSLSCRTPVNPNDSMDFNTSSGTERGPCLPSMYHVSATAAMAESRFQALFQRSCTKRKGMAKAVPVLSRLPGIAQDPNAFGEELFGEESPEYLTTLYSVPAVGKEDIRIYHSMQPNHVIAAGLSSGCPEEGAVNRYAAPCPRTNLLNGKLSETSHSPSHVKKGANGSTLKEPLELKATGEEGHEKVKPTSEALAVQPKECASPNLLSYEGVEVDPTNSLSVEVPLQKEATTTTTDLDSVAGSTEETAAERPLPHETRVVELKEVELAEACPPLPAALNSEKAMEAEGQVGNNVDVEEKGETIISATAVQGSQSSLIPVLLHSSESKLVFKTTASVGLLPQRIAPHQGEDSGSIVSSSVVPPGLPLPFRPTQEDRRVLYAFIHLLERTESIERKALQQALWLEHMALSTPLELVNYTLRLSLQVPPIFSSLLLDMRDKEFMQHAARLFHEEQKGRLSLVDEYSSVPLQHLSRPILDPAAEIRTRSMEDLAQAAEDPLEMAKQRQAMEAQVPYYYSPLLQQRTSQTAPTTARSSSLHRKNHYPQTLRCPSEVNSVLQPNMGSSEVLPAAAAPSTPGGPLQTPKASSPGGTGPTTNGTSKPLKVVMTPLRYDPHPASPKLLPSPHLQGRTSALNSREKDLPFLLPAPLLPLPMSVPPSTESGANPSAVTPSVSPEIALSATVETQLLTGLPTSIFDLDNAFIPRNSIPEFNWSAESPAHFPVLNSPAESSVQQLTSSLFTKGPPLPMLLTRQQTLPGSPHAATVSSLSSALQHNRHLSSSGGGSNISPSHSSLNATSPGPRGSFKEGSVSTSSTPHPRSQQLRKAIVAGRVGSPTSNRSSSRQHLPLPQPPFNVSGPGRSRLMSGEEVLFGNNEEPEAVGSPTSSKNSSGDILCRLQLDMLDGNEDLWGDDVAEMEEQPVLVVHHVDHSAPPPPSSEGSTVIRPTTHGIGGVAAPHRPSRSGLLSCSSRGSLPFGLVESRSGPEAVGGRNVSDDSEADMIDDEAEVISAVRTGSRGRRMSRKVVQQHHRTRRTSQVHAKVKQQMAAHRSGAASTSEGSPNTNHPRYSAASSTILFRGSVRKSPSAVITGEVASAGTSTSDTLGPTRGALSSPFRPPLRDPLQSTSTRSLGAGGAPIAPPRRRRLPVGRVEDEEPLLDRDSTKSPSILWHFPSRDSMSSPTGAHPQQESVDVVSMIAEENSLEAMRGVGSSSSAFTASVGGPHVVVVRSSFQERISGTGEVSGSGRPPSQQQGFSVPSGSSSPLGSTRKIMLPPPVSGGASSGTSSPPLGSACSSKLSASLTLPQPAENSSAGFSPAALPHQQFSGSITSAPRIDSDVPSVRSAAPTTTAGYARTPPPPQPSSAAMHVVTTNMNRKVSVEASSGAMSSFGTTTSSSTSWGSTPPSSSSSLFLCGAVRLSTAERLQAPTSAEDHTNIHVHHRRSTVEGNHSSAAPHPNPTTGNGKPPKPHPGVVLPPTHPLTGPGHAVVGYATPPVSNHHHHHHHHHRKVPKDAATSSPRPPTPPHRTIYEAAKGTRAGLLAAGHGTPSLSPSTISSSIPKVPWRAASRPTTGHKRRIPANCPHVSEETQEGTSRRSPLRQHGTAPVEDARPTTSLPSSPVHHPPADVAAVPSVSSASTSRGSSPVEKRKDTNAGHRHHHRPPTSSSSDLPSSQKSSRTGDDVMAGGPHAALRRVTTARGTESVPEDSATSRNRRETDVEEEEREVHPLRSAAASVPLAAVSTTPRQELEPREEADVAEEAEEAASPEDETPQPQGAGNPTKLVAQTNTGKPVVGHFTLYEDRLVPPPPPPGAMPSTEGDEENPGAAFAGDWSPLEEEDGDDGDEEKKRKYSSFSSERSFMTTESSEIGEWVEDRWADHDRRESAPFAFGDEQLPYVYEEDEEDVLTRGVDQLVFPSESFLSSSEEGDYEYGEGTSSSEVVNAGERHWKIFDEPARPPAPDALAMAKKSALSARRGKGLLSSDDSSDPNSTPVRPHEYGEEEEEELLVSTGESEEYEEDFSLDSASQPGDLDGPGEVEEESAQPYFPVIPPPPRFGDLSFQSKSRIASGDDVEKEGTEDVAKDSAHPTHTEQEPEGSSPVGEGAEDGRDSEALLGPVSDAPVAQTSSMK